MLALPLLLSLASPAAIQDCTDLDAAHRRMTVPLVESEREFARSARSSLNDAYLGVLGRDSIAFKPMIVDSTAWWSENYAGNVRVQWAPQYAGVSATGDFGYTFGPLQGRVEGSDQVLQGSYLSVWQRDGAGGLDGRWRLLADHWVSHAPERLTRYARCRQPGRSDVVIRSGHAQRMEALKQIEEHISSATYLPDAWVLRNGVPPRPGQGQCKVASQRTRLSRSGDMAFTAGAEDAQRSFLRVWRFDRDSGWRIEVELCSLPVG